MTALVLVGLMGAGKSTVGRIVADRLERPFVDSDATIEAQTGRTVRELWEEGGEAAYRALESGFVIDAVQNGGDVVVAAPGGAVLDERVRTALAAVDVVWLRADPATLAGRVEIGDHRPLLGDDPEPVLRDMAERRDTLYRQVADVIVDVDGLDPATVADQLLALCPLEHSAH